MKLNYLFVTESNWFGKVPDKFENMRTEYAWMKAFDATHEPLHTFVLNSFKSSIDNISKYNWVFFILPKNEKRLIQFFNSDFVLNLKKYIKSSSRNTKFAFIQEGPCWYFTDYSISTQIFYYNFLQMCDLLLVHNYSDVNYYKGLWGDKKPVQVIPALMYTDTIRDINKIEKKEKIIIGGNFVHWYGGFESNAVAKTISTRGETELEIWAPSMGRKQKSEDQLIKHLPYMNWTQWMYSLAEFKYAVHLMPVEAAGTFALNCSYLGIPCIGNKNVDTIRGLHPELAVDFKDIYGAKLLAERLREDKFFYSLCSYQTQTLYNERYSIEVFKKYILGMFENELWNDDEII